MANYAGKKGKTMKYADGGKAKKKAIKKTVKKYVRGGKVKAKAKAKVAKSKYKKGMKYK